MKELKLLEHKVLQNPVIHVENEAVASEQEGVNNETIMNELETDNKKEQPLTPMEALYRRCLIKADEEFDEEDFMLEIDGIKFFAKGNIALLKAAKKQGKSQTIAIMAATVIGCRQFRLTCPMKDAKVLVVDTEMARRDSHRLYTRILRMVGCCEEDIEKRFSMINLREETYESRLNMVDYAIRTKRPDIVFVDGVVDLCGNFNDLERSELVINRLMRLSSVYNCVIVGVLHTNPSDEGGKARGHIGTGFMNKASEVLEVKKDSGIFTVKTHCSRGIEPSSWKFMFDSNGNLTSADNYMDNIKKQIAEEKAQKVAEETAEKLKAFIIENGGQASKKELADYMMEKEQLGHTTAYERIKKAEGFFEIANDLFRIPSTTTAENAFSMEKIYDELYNSDDKEEEDEFLKETNMDRSF